MTAIAVTIAGSDSGGGAGIQADLKTFSARGVYGASVITALTAQNTLGVSGVHDVPPGFVSAQIDAVFSDLSVNATKIGMLSRTDTIEAVADGLARYHPGPVILDPVMVAASGDPLIADNAVETLRQLLLPIATVITPNLPEAARLLGEEPAIDSVQMEEQARRLLGMTNGAVLLKGGHAGGKEAGDLLVAGKSEIWLRAPRIDTENNHGTGCTLSSAIAAEMAKGADIPSAARAAKDYVHGALAAGRDLQIGRGRGPVHHFHQFWSDQ